MYRSPYGHRVPVNGWGAGNGQWNVERPRSINQVSRRPVSSGAPLAPLRRNGVILNGDPELYRDELMSNGIDVWSDDSSSDWETVDYGRRSPHRQWRITKVKRLNKHDATSTSFIPQDPHMYPSEAPYWQSAPARLPPRLFPSPPCPPALAYVYPLPYYPYRPPPPRPPASYPYYPHY